MYTGKSPCASRFEWGLLFAYICEVTWVSTEKQLSSNVRTMCHWAADSVQLIQGYGNIWSLFGNSDRVPVHLA